MNISSGDVGRQIEPGRVIGITCRNHVRKRVSPGFLIAGFNLRGVLKPKGNCRVQVVLLLWQL